MSLGAYSLIRFTNDLSDQRVNLGVIVWHPADGFAHRWTHQLDRAKAVDPRVYAADLKQQLAAIASQITVAREDENGKEFLRGLNRQFRYGIEVSAPYPAEVTDTRAMLETLYAQLVSPVPEIFRAATQTTFEKTLKKNLRTAIRDAGPNVQIRDVPKHRINGVSVDVGTRTFGPGLKATWRALSLQADDRAPDQLAKAKALALDISLVREHVDEVKHDKQVVALRPPKAKATDRLKDVRAWLEHEADRVVIVPETEDGLAGVLAQELSRLSSSKHRN